MIRKAIIKLMECCGKKEADTKDSNFWELMHMVESVKPQTNKLRNSLL